MSLIEAVPYQGKKKGADGGIDGIVYFHEDTNTTEWVIVQVKGGNNVGVSAIRDLKGTMEREKSPLGLLITLAEPTAPMKKEAIASGFHTIYGGKGENFQKFKLRQLEICFAENLRNCPLSKVWFSKGQKRKNRSRRVCCNPFICL